MIPDYVFKHLESEFKDSGDQHLLANLRLNRKLAKIYNRPRRNFTDTDPGVCSRFTSDAQNKESEGVLKLSESSFDSDDPVINTGHRNAANIRRFYSEVLGYNSYDNRGVDLRTTVHYGKNYNNAFFNGEFMAFGDGDGLVFTPLVMADDVHAHEIGHGTVAATANLVYLFEPGALNEHFADVFGVCARHFFEKTPFDKACWLLGDKIVGPKFPGKAIRSFLNEKAYKSDPQPKHKKNQYFGFEDNGGVHINSGIPNHAFYLFCKGLHEAGIDSNSFGVALTKVWLPALLQLGTYSGFGDMKKATTKACRLNLPQAQEILSKAWAGVGM